MFYEINGKVLRTQMFEVSFDHDVREVISYDKLFIVLLNPFDGNGKAILGLSSNIYGLSAFGEIVWQVQNPRVFFENCTVEGDGVFVGIDRGEDNAFSALTFSSLRCTCDCQTGKLLGKERMYW